MRQPLKERIQQAIDNAVFRDEVEYGALIVGGRRIPRKKRKHRTVKKDQNNNNSNKKQNKKDQNKNKKYFNKNCQDEEAKTGDKSPLVKHDSLEKVDQHIVFAEDLQSSTSQEAEQAKAQAKESQSGFKMPFSFFKKKEPVDEKPLKEENELKAETEEKVEAAVNEVTEVVSKDAETAIISTAKIPDKDVGDQDGGTENKDGQVKQANGELKKAELETTCEDGHRKIGEENETKDEAKLIKKEDTPLIKNESNVKDTGPGMLCCTIM